MTTSSEDSEPIFDAIPSVVFERVGGETVEVGLGGLIGRGIDADLQLADPRVSVAHSGISLRKGALQLLAYRGRHWIRGIEYGDVVLRPGLVIEFATGVTLTVREVRLPALLPTIQIDDRPAWPVDSRAWHIDASGNLREGRNEERPQMWDSHGDWYVQAPGEDAVGLCIGDSVDVGGHRVTLELYTPEAASDAGTARDDPPSIEIHSYVSETELHFPDRPIVRLRQNNHTLIRELGRRTAHTGQTVPWMEIAEAIWPNPNQKHDKLWYRQRSRLVVVLARHGITLRLVRSDGGQVRLELREQDRFHLHDPDE